MISLKSGVFVSVSSFADSIRASEPVVVEPFLKMNPLSTYVPSRYKRRPVQSEANKRIFDIEALIANAALEQGLHVF